MDAVTIIKDELKKSGLELAEESAKKLFLVISENIVPRLAEECEDAKIKSLASVAKIVLGALEAPILAAIDKIDGEVG